MKENTENKDKKNKRDDSDWDDTIEKPYKQIHGLNESNSVFVESKFKGINSEKSIFDRTAIFHTK